MVEGGDDTLQLLWRRNCGKGGQGTGGFETRQPTNTVAPSAAGMPTFGLMCERRSPSTMNSCEMATTRSLAVKPNAITTCGWLNLDKTSYSAYARDDTMSVGTRRLLVGTPLLGTEVGEQCCGQMRRVEQGQTVAKSVGVERGRTDGTLAMPVSCFLVSGENLSVNTFSATFLFSGVSTNHTCARTNQHARLPHKSPQLTGSRLQRLQNGLRVRPPKKRGNRRKKQAPERRSQALLPENTTSCANLGLAGQRAAGSAHVWCVEDCGVV